MKATARKGYDETVVFPRGFTVAVAEHLDDLVLRVELHDSARIERMPLEPHEARQIASLLRNGTELDHIPHRSCDEALEAARKERDDATDEFARMLRERDEWKRRAEYAERELSDALGLPAAIGPAEGEAKRIVDAGRAAITDIEALRAEESACFDFARFHDAKAAWSLATFGPGDRYAGVLEHIRRELQEIDAQPSDLSEWVDVILLAMDGAWRSAGASGAQLVSALIAKQAKNLARKWPDWRSLQPGEVSQHIRDGGDDA